MKLKEIGEAGALKRIFKIVEPVYPGNNLALGDDASYIKSHNLVMSIDGYSAIKSKYPWESWRTWGWRAVVASISDLIAKGAKPIAVLVSVGLPGEYEYSVLEDIMYGVVEAVYKHNLLFAGGDLNSSIKDPWIDVASIGELVLDKPIPRSNIKPGDKVYTTLANGYGVNGFVLKAYYKGARGFESKIGIIKPRAVMEFLKIALRIKPSASIDVSDGLLKSLWLLAESSRVRISLIKLPENTHVESLCKEYGVDCREAILEGGEEYEIIFTSKLEPNEVYRVCRDEGVKCMLIGEAESGEPGVFLGDSKLELKGWDQFRC